MILGHRIKSKLFGAVIASALLSGHVTVANPQHGIAMYGAPALPHDFVSLPYANPDAPQGGTIVSAEGGTFTSLNPHVYLDTIGLIGAVSAQYDADSLRYAFATGASIGSLVFFCSLGFGARILAPVMGSRKAWRVLDVLVGLTMWTIAALLVSS